MKQDLDNKQPEDRLTQGVAVGGAGTVVGGGVLAAVLMPQYRNAFIIFLVTAILVAVIAGGIYLFLRARKRKQRAEGLEKGLKGGFDKESAASSDQDQKAGLEVMKRKFMLLIERLRTEGNQNIYDMPWFLTIGPSGTGKSWVLKASGLEQLEDSDWKKGTFMIDWWTSSEALVLDTAGGVVFGEDKGYDTPEWKSLLELLRKYRPQCPINGVFVVIPSQLLWLKHDEIPTGWLSLEEYAEALRLQIRKQLQRTLGVRFPIYFLVTQSDRLPGFREFSDALEANGTPCGQMLGWSNPVNVGQDNRFRKTSDRRNDPEYEPIKQIADSLRQVVENLRRQRLVLLNKYAGESARTEDVVMSVRERAADLFTFPDTIQSTLAPRLQEFLETVFRPDPTLPKPPYLRGIYFTSALREGEVLDRQRARMGGKSLADLALPGGADRRQPKPFFLKDIFYEKAFQEAWLVTPLVEAGKYLKQRRRMLIWSGIGATALLLVAIGVGGWTFRETVGGELEQWKQAESAARNPQDRYWLPVVEPVASGFQVMTNNVGIHGRLANAANAGLERSTFWSFRWLFRSSTLDKPRRNAQLKMFERGVIRPLADHTRKMMMDSVNSPVPSSREDLQGEINRFEGAWLALLELELSDIGTLKGSELERSRDRVVDGCVNYLLSQEKDSVGPRFNRSIKDAFNATYSDENRQKDWPPLGARHPQSLTNLVYGAFQRIKVLHTAQATLLSEKRTQLNGMVFKAQQISEMETNLLVAIQNHESTERLRENLQFLGTNWNQLLLDFKESRNRSFGQSFANFVSEVERDAEGRRDQLLKQLQQVNGAMQRIGTNWGLIEVLDRGIQSMIREQPKSVEGLTNFTSLRSQAGNLDARFLAVAPGQETQTDADFQRLLDRRLDLYKKTIEISPQLPRGWEKDLFEETIRAPPPAEIIDTIPKSAMKAWGGLPMNAVAGFAMESGDYTTVLTNYILSRYYEGALRLGEIKTTNLLNSGYRLALSGRGKPMQMLLDVETLQARLKRLEGIWDELDRRWKDLGESGVAPIDRSKQAVVEKRNALSDAVKMQIQEEEKTYNDKGFPLVVAEKPASERDVRTSWERAKAWREAIQNRIADVKNPSDIPKEEAEEWDKTVSLWWDKFEQLLDEKGNILDYEVISPWVEQKDQFSKVVGGLSEAAKIDSVKYRDWKWDQTWIRADDNMAKQPPQLAAARGFTLEAKTVRELQEKIPTKVETVPRSNAWTIIDLIRRRETKHDSNSMRYYVPIAVSGDKGAATVWFVIRSIDPKR